jgi:hypothetical protein
LCHAYAAICRSIDLLNVILSGDVDLIHDRSNQLTSDFQEFNRFQIDRFIDR